MAWRAGLRPVPCVAETGALLTQTGYHGPHSRFPADSPTGMLKRIHVHHLSPGMFIHEFCGSWMEHPF